MLKDQNLSINLLSTKRKQFVVTRAVDFIFCIHNEPFSRFNNLVSNLSVIKDTEVQNRVQMWVKKCRVIELAFNSFLQRKRCGHCKDMLQTALFKTNPTIGFPHTCLYLIAKLAIKPSHRIKKFSNHHIRHCNNLHVIWILYSLNIAATVQNWIICIISILLCFYP